MKKKLNTDTIVNELRGSSAHFRRPADVQEENASEAVQEVDAEEIATEEQAEAPSPPTVVAEASDDETVPKPKARRPTRPRSTTTTNTSGDQVELIELIRKNVKPVGKEAAFCRFTPEEKSALGDVVYTYKRNGIRTSENEIVRVAVNWLIENYHDDGQHSVLAQVLEKLNA